jgi:hypothetical protein
MRGHLCQVQISAQRSTWIFAGKITWLVAGWWGLSGIKSNFFLLFLPDFEISENPNHHRPVTRNNKLHKESRPFLFLCIDDIDMYKPARSRRGPIDDIDIWSPGIKSVWNCGWTACIEWVIPKLVYKASFRGSFKWVSFTLNRLSHGYFLWYGSVIKKREEISFI